MSEKQEQVKDGFDLIEYPSDYAFKAMCRVTENTDLVDHLSKRVCSIVSESALLDVRTSSSRTGKYNSLTLKVKVENRDQLEAIYQIIADSPVVVMTL